MQLLVFCDEATGIIPECLGTCNCSHYFSSHYLFSTSPNIHVRGKPTLAENILHKQLLHIASPSSSQWLCMSTALIVNTNTGLIVTSQHSTRLLKSSRACQDNSFWREAISEYLKLMVFTELLRDFSDF